MGDLTAIEWTDHTFNPWWGCSRVSPACVGCYADRDATRWGHNNLWRRHGERKPLSDAYWRKPAKWNRDAEQAGKPLKVFCASMADVFEDHPQVGPWRERLWTVIDSTPWLTWQLLTKRVENVAAMVPWTGTWPRNVWIGTSVETQRFAQQRIPILQDLRHAAVRFLSCEPLLGPVSLHPWLATPDLDSGTAIDWVIAGGESGPKARPSHPDWFRLLRDQCIASSVPFLFKQWGEWAPIKPDTWSAMDWHTSPHRNVLVTPTGRAKPMRDITGTEPHGSHPMYRAGKKAAGRLLDHRTWDQYPQENTYA